MGKLEKVGSVSSESVRQHTKKDWDEWVELLGKRVGGSWSHQEIVALLKKEFRLSVWWQQEVARGYQIAAGIRKPHETLKGTYTTTATKSIEVAPTKIFSFLVSARGVAVWLQSMGPVEIKKGRQFECSSSIFGEFRVVEKNKKIRLSWINEDWPSKSTVEIHLYPKPQKKCMIVVNHIDLPTMKAKEEMHNHWRRVVDEIAEMIA